jgi:hypothetical protein
MLKVHAEPEVVLVLPNAIQEGRQAVADVNRAQQQPGNAIQVLRPLSDVKPVENLHNS